MRFFCDHCGADAPAATETCAHCPDAFFHLACMTEHRESHGVRREKRAVLPGRDSPRARAAMKRELASTVGPTGTAGFEAAAKDHRFVVGHMSHFYDPAVSIAKGIADALNPDTPMNGPVREVEHHDAGVLKPHQIQRKKWRDWRGKRGTCPLCGRERIPLMARGLFRHLTGHDVWCKTPEQAKSDRRALIGAMLKRRA